MIYVINSFHRKQT